MFVTADGLTLPLVAHGEWAFECHPWNDRGDAATELERFCGGSGYTTASEVWAMVDPQAGQASGLLLGATPGFPGRWCRKVAGIMAGD